MFASFLSCEPDSCSKPENYGTCRVRSLIRGSWSCIWGHRRPVVRGVRGGRAVASCVLKCKCCSLHSRPLPKRRIERASDQNQKRNDAESSCVDLAHATGSASADPEHPIHATTHTYLDYTKLTSIVQRLHTVQTAGASSPSLPNHQPHCEKSSRSTNELLKEELQALESRGEMSSVMAIPFCATDRLRSHPAYALCAGDRRCHDHPVTPRNLALAHNLCHRLYCRRPNAPCSLNPVP